MHPTRLLLLIFGSCFAATAATTMTIDAGELDRSDAIVEFDLPPGVKGNRLATSGGDSTALQISRDGRATFIVHSLPRGQKRTYTFKEGETPAFAEAKSEHSNVSVTVFGKPVFTYRGEKTSFPENRPDLTPIYQRGGYIHPVLSPSGKQVTDDYARNHKHQHGIWFAWTHTEFEGRKPDFWNMGDRKGTVEFVSLDDTWSGPVHAGFTSRHRQVDFTADEPKTALNETWRVRAFAVGREVKRPYFLFDVEISDSCATSASLKLPQYRYGGIGLRGNWAWNGKTNVNFLNSDGSTDRSKGDRNQTQGRWAYMGGLVDGGLTGIAVLGHPTNVRAPQPIRIHPTEPFLNFAPQQAGNVEITPGKPLTLRYRFVVIDGAPDAAELQRLWADYASPPKVTFGTD